MVSDILKEAAGQEIMIKFSSIGGYIYPALLIYNMIKDYEGKKYVIINGLVASASAYILMAFDKIIAKDNSIFMIHNAKNGIFGDYRALAKEAQELKKLNTTIGIEYARVSEKKLNKILNLMDDETWLYGKEIVDEGFAHKMEESEEGANKEQDLEVAMHKYNCFKPPVIEDDVFRAVAIINKDNNNYEYDNNSGVAGKTNKIKGENQMDKDELLKHIGSLKSNEIKLEEIAIAMNMSDKLVTSEHINAIALADEFAKLNIENPVEAFKAMQIKLSENSEAIYSARITEEFGAEKLQNGSENLLRKYAKNQLKDVQADELDKAITELKENDPIAKELASKSADVNSETNTVAVAEQSNKTIASTSKRKVDKV